MPRSVFYQPASADPDTDPWTRARGVPPFDVTGLTNGTEYRFDDGQQVFVRTPAAAPAFDPDPDAAAYITAGETVQGSSLHPAIAAAVHEFVAGCKEDESQREGVSNWDALGFALLMAGWSDMSAALISLKGPAVTNNGFVQSDYDPVTGLKGDGISKSIDTNYPGNSNLTWRAHLAVYVTEHHTPPNTSSAYMGNGVGSEFGNSQIVFIGGENIIRVRINGDSAQRSDFPGANTVTGFMCFSRRDGNDIQAVVDGQVSTVSNFARTPLSENIQVFSRTPSSPNYANARLAFASTGLDVDGVALGQRVEALMSAIAGAL